VLAHAFWWAEVEADLRESGDVESFHFHSDADRETCMVAIGLVLVAIGLVLVAIGLILVAIDLVLVAIGLVLVTIGLVLVAIGLVLVAIGLVLVAIGLVLVAIGLVLVDVGLRSWASNSFQRRGFLRKMCVYRLHFPAKV
jgi:hypothetical protein